MLLEQIPPEWCLSPIKSHQLETQRFSWALLSLTLCILYIIRFFWICLEFFDFFHHHLHHPSPQATVISWQNFCFLPDPSTFLSSYSRSQRQTADLIASSLQPTRPPNNIYKTLQWLFHCSWGHYNSWIWSAVHKPLSELEPSLILTPHLCSGHTGLLILPLAHFQLSSVWKYPPLLTPSSSFSSQLSLSLEGLPWCPQFG